jgi:hypothetical protein
MTFKVEFLDSGREPKDKPDPAFPEGRHIVVSDQIQKACTRNLPYPAPRCGTYRVTCEVCGYVAAISVAGRTDDPRILTIPCKR